MTRAGSRGYLAVFDAHMVSDDRGAAGVIEDAIAAATYLGRDGMTVVTNPYAAARSYVESGSALIYDADIRALWREIGLGVSYARLSESAAWDRYIAQVGDYLARNGYVAAARTERARLTEQGHR